MLTSPFSVDHSLNREGCVLDVASQHASECNVQLNHVIFVLDASLGTV